MRAARVILIALFLLPGGCKRKPNLPVMGSSRRPTEGTVLLCRAVRDGDVERVKSLLPDCIDLNAQDKDGSTPLHNAASAGKVDIAKLLIKRGADVNAKAWRAEGIVGEYDYTPLHYAAERGHVDMADLLIAAGANINAKTRFGRTPLLLAVAGGHQAVARLLIAHGVNVNAADNRRTPLGMAIAKDDREMAQLLVAAGATNTLQAAAYFGDQ